MLLNIEANNNQGVSVVCVGVARVKSAPNASKLARKKTFPSLSLSDEDSVFLAAGFFDGESGAGRHFSISYRNITTATNSDPDSLATEELFRTISANNNWLTFPVTFVGVQRADYSVMNEQSPSDYQFWFIFLREQLVTDNVIYSRLVRVCRNDPGSMATDGGAARHFSTFMKARIFCVRDKPTTLEFIDSLDFVYNSISESYITLHNTVSESYITLHNTVSESYITLHNTVSESYITLHNTVSESYTTLHNSISESYITLHNTVSESYITLHNTVSESYITLHNTVSESYTTLHNTVSESYTTLHNTVSESYITLHNTVSESYITLHNTVSESCFHYLSEKRFSPQLHNTVYLLLYAAFFEQSL